MKSKDLLQSDSEDACGTKLVWMRQVLQSRKNNLILVGEPGVGKTGIVEEFAQLLADGKLPDALGRTEVIEIFE